MGSTTQLFKFCKNKQTNKASYLYLFCSPNLSFVQACLVASIYFMPTRIKQNKGRTISIQSVCRSCSPQAPIVSEKFHCYFQLCLFKVNDTHPQRWIKPADLILQSPSLTLQCYCSENTVSSNSFRTSAQAGLETQLLQDPRSV